jgi:hypothetical protein
MKTFSTIQDWKATEYVIELQCSFEKIRSDTENFTPNLNKPAATTNTMNNDDSSLFLSSDPEDLDHVGDDVNISVGSNELKVIDSRPDTNKNDIGNYLSNKLSIDDNLKYPL